MNTIDELLKSLGLEELIADDEDATTSENTIVSTSSTIFYVKGENETAEDFVQRLPPSTTLLPEHTDYIAINTNRNIDGLESFLKKGRKLLKRYKEKYVNKKNKAPPHPLLGKILLEKLTLMAIEENFLESRFGLVPPAEKVDSIWLKIVQGTMAGGLGILYVCQYSWAYSELRVMLGINAKIDRKTSKYFIRVYIKDFTDKADKTRVFTYLYNLNLGIDYVDHKGSFLSKLGISKDNIFNITRRYHPSTNLSTMLDDHSMGFFYEVKKENESAESFVVRLSPSKVLHPNNGFITTYPDKEDVGCCTATSVGSTLLKFYKYQIGKTSGYKRYRTCKELEKKLTQLSVECNFVKGRWIAYASDNVDSLWLKTVQATMNGTLGVNARIKKYNDYNLYEINVMTIDFNDEEDVMRVLAEMKKLGFSPPFLYKTQLYRCLNIKAYNDYGLYAFLHDEWTDGRKTAYGMAVN